MFNVGNTAHIPILDSGIKQSPYVVTLEAELYKDKDLLHGPPEGASCWVIYLLFYFAISEGKCNIPTGSNRPWAFSWRRRAFNRSRAAEQEVQSSVAPSLGLEEETDRAEASWGEQVRRVSERSEDRKPGKGMTQSLHTHPQKCISFSWNVTLSINQKFCFKEAIH